MSESARTTTSPTIPGPTRPTFPVPGTIAPPRPTPHPPAPEPPAPDPPVPGLPAPITACTAPARASRARIGELGERYARHHMERAGYVVLAERARTRHGEIDLVLFGQRTTVFCEVKTRVGRGGVVPWHSLTAQKCRQVRRLAGAWLAENPDRPTSPDLRFDAITVVVDREGELLRLDHLEAAF